MAEINREKVIKGLECCSEHIEDASCSDCPYVDDCDIGECTSELAHDTLSLLKEPEEQKRKWLQNIADNQLSIGGVDPLTEYEQGKWDGLAMAFEILTEER